MKVVFLMDVPNQGYAGDVKEVSDGYGRNYLIPRGLAVLATPAELKRVERTHQVQSYRYERSEEHARAFAQILEDTQVVLKAKVGARKRLYGSITSADIADAVERLTGEAVDKRRIELENPIRRLGDHEVTIKLTRETTARLKVVVEEEGEETGEVVRKRAKSAAEVKEEIPEAQSEKEEVKQEAETPEKAEVKEETGEVVRKRAKSAAKVKEEIPETKSEKEEVKQETEAPEKAEVEQETEGTESEETSQETEKPE